MKSTINQLSLVIRSLMYKHPSVKQFAGGKKRLRRLLRLSKKTKS